MQIGEKDDSLYLDLSEELQQLKTFGQDSSRSIEKYWWTNREISCAGMFADEIVDAGFCLPFSLIDR